MIKKFEVEIRKKIVDMAKTSLPGYSEVKRNKGSREIVFFKKDGGVDKYVSFIFLKDRDYIIPALQWSRVGDRPEESVLSIQELVKAREDIDWVYGKESGWIGLCEFGKVNNFVEINGEYPDEDRLSVIFSDESAKSLLDSIGVENWRDAPSLHSWEMIDELLPHAIKEADVEKAITPVMDELKLYVDGYFVPFLEKMH